eukprot:scaffold71919_cov45-Attheya_sp.AAC.1
MMIWITHLIALVALNAPLASLAFSSHPIGSTPSRLPTTHQNTWLEAVRSADKYPIDGDNNLSVSAIPERTKSKHELRKKEWINRSVRYYSTVMREEQRRRNGQLKVDLEQEIEVENKFVEMATKHYFAIRKVKNGELKHAEGLYRRIINELSTEDEGHCDHAKLAVSTLLLSLLLQRMGDVKGTRSVFLNFFRLITLSQEEDEDVECACSAKVMQAFGLFEMKQGNKRKSLELVTRAVKLDKTLAPVLLWKHFRDVDDRIGMKQKFAKNQR